MATDFELALMAGHAYQSTRKEINRFPTPQNWQLIDHDEKDSGFEAVAFQRTTNPNEIVISFAGTYPGQLGDLAADAGLASGNGSIQLNQAINYYLQIKAENPNAKIILTGHSLGGGLAALVGVFFGVEAVTFDQAPFANSAKATSPVADDLLTYLQNNITNNVYTDPKVVTECSKAISALQTFIQQRATTGGIPNSGIIKTISVEGELLSSNPPFTLFDIIGQQPEILTHGGGNISWASFIAGTGLHSQALLTAFLYGDRIADNKTLREVSKELPKLVEMLCDTSLFSFDTDKDKVNFLELLVQHQADTNTGTSDTMIERFTGDLWKIAQDGGLTMTDANITKMLTAFAMEAYYNQGKTGGSLTASESLFDATTVSGNKFLSGPGIGKSPYTTADDRPWRCAA